MATVLLEGQELELPDEIVATDDLLKKALSPYYPGVSDAEIKRETKDDKAIVTVVKRAGPKGNANLVVASLDETPRHLNPAIALYQQLQDSTMLPEDLALMESHIDQAIEQGEAEMRAVNEASQKLAAAAPVPGPIVFPGF